jgi:hypothetical protein
MKRLGDLAKPQKKKKKPNEKEERESFELIHPTQTRPVGWTSLTWLYFSYDININAQYSQCLLCGDLISYNSNGTTSCTGQEKHLKTVHHMVKIPENLTFAPKVAKDPFTQSTLNKGSKIEDDWRNGLNVARWWSFMGLARKNITHKLTRTAFPRDIPRGVSVGDLESLITDVAHGERELLVQEFEGGTVCIELDAGRKMKRDFTNLLMNGKYVQSYEIGFTETSDNVVKWLLGVLAKKQTEFKCLVTCLINDNAAKGDVPAHQVATEMGYIHCRCVPHSANLGFKDLFSCTNPVCLDLQRLFGEMNDLTKIIMNRKEPLKKFRESQVAENKSKTPLILIKVGDTRWTCRTSAIIRFDLLLPHVIHVTTTSKWTVQEIVKMKKESLKNVLQSENVQGDIDALLNHFTKEATEQVNVRRSSDSEELPETNVRSRRMSDEAYSISTMDQEKIHNFAIGFMVQVQVWMKRLQIYRLSLYEWTLMWKEIRIHGAKIEKWDSTKLDWIQNLHTKFHKIAKEELQTLWRIFLKLLDDRSHQFNDQLVSFCETFIPRPYGLPNSFEDCDEVVSGILGISEKPIDSDANRSIWGLGPRLLKRYLDFQNESRPGPILAEEEVAQLLRSQYILFCDKSTWSRALNDCKGNPIVFWETQAKSGNMKNLAQIVLLIMLADCTNVNVERSMKVLADIVSEKRNRLGLGKICEESLIKFNHNDQIKNEDRHTRIQGCYALAEKAYDTTGIVKKDELDFIKIIEDVVVTKKGKKRKSQTTQGPSVETVTIPKASRKTKIFQNISTNPEYINSKRKTRSTKVIVDHDDDDDDDEFEDIEDEYEESVPSTDEVTYL